MLWIENVNVNLGYKFRMFAENVKMFTNLSEIIIVGYKLLGKMTAIELSVHNQLWREKRLTVSGHWSTGALVSKHNLLSQFGISVDSSNSAFNGWNNNCKRYTSEQIAIVSKDNRSTVKTLTKFFLSIEALTNNA